MSLEKMKLKYYFSVTSPFCYVGNPRIFDMEKTFGITWELKPYAIERSADPSPPDPNEMKYMREDIRRLTNYYKLPLTFPQKPPKDRLPLECFFIAYDQGKGREYILAVTHAFWGLGKDIGDPDILAEIASSIGLNRKDFKDKSVNPTLKERLKKSTEEGNSYGVFGVPTLLVENELFWGQDRLEFARVKLENLIKKSF